MIKVWDYLKEYEELKDEVLQEIDNVFKSGTLIFGPKTEILWANFMFFT